MILSDNEILEYGDRLIEPFDKKRVQPASYDLVLHDVILKVLDNSFKIIDLRTNSSDNRFKRYNMSESGDFVLYPKHCMIASTKEIIHCPSDLAARVEGKSSIGRLFIAVHVTAGFVDPGFNGQITLEVVNHGHWPIRFYPGMPIAQINFMKLISPSKVPYGTKGLGSHYAGQLGPTPAKGNREMENSNEPEGKE